MMYLLTGFLIFFAAANAVAGLLCAIAADRHRREGWPWRWLIQATLHWVAAWILGFLAAAFNMPMSLR